LSEAILEFQAVLDTVSRLIAELIGDTCAIRLLSEDGQWFELVAIYHSQSAAIAPMRELLAAPQSSHGGLMAQVMQTGQPLLIPVVSQEELSNSVNQSYLTYLEQFHISSILIAPLRVRGCAIGTLEIFRDRSDYPYTVDDLVFLQDLADRAALAIENARLYHQALEANRLKDDFLAVVSHELRTPLNAVLGWASLLRTRKFNPEKTAQALEVIERNAKLQTQLIEDLLDISRLLRGQLRLNCRPLDLIPVLEAVIKTVLPTAEAKSINFRFSILDFGLGDSAQEPATIEANELAFNLKTPTPNPKFLVWADPDRLQQVIWNLLSNAIKFTPTGGRVEVRLSLVNSSSFMGNGNQQSTINNYTNYIQIQVSDTGKGISPDFLPYVFDRFRQAENAITRSQGGLGLGLAIVRQLVELHGGNVCADSSGIGQGATFTVKLPLWETVKSEEIFGQPVLA
jgi:signal transduction histidine kinase